MSFLKRKNHEKIFCISIQRTGTTSTGQFFKDHDYKVATWGTSSKNNWGLKYFSGDYNGILKSRAFKANQVFEDGPWWVGDFYKYLYHLFPYSKFILLERDPDKWFDSMVSHSKGKTLGNAYRHCIIYGRENEVSNNEIVCKDAYSASINNLLELNEEHRDHYKRIYVNKNRAVKLFFEFHDPNRLFTCRLEDPNLWQKMGRYFNIDVEDNYRVHSNRSL